MHRQQSPRRNTVVSEILEPRTLLSESASASVALLSTTGTGASTVYHYGITLKDTGTHLPAILARCVLVVDRLWFHGQPLKFPNMKFSSGGRERLHPWMRLSRPPSAAT